MSNSRRKPLVVVAGQVPPPTGGQNVMIQLIVEELSAGGPWRTVHLPFFFTPSFQNVRRVRLAKIIELGAVWGRFLGLVVRHGRPDILLYPSGGPQTVPVVRDLLLLPLFCALSRKVLVQFHAAGIADRLAKKKGILEKLIVRTYSRVSGAIVMTNFNRCDPEALGIARIAVIPHRLEDKNPEGARPDYAPSEGAENGVAVAGGMPRQRSPFRILHAGHLYDQKGTPQLLEAFGKIARQFPEARLVLMGEFLSPYSAELCRARCTELNIGEQVEITGVLHGEKKFSQFRAAHLFVFCSIAPYESFGLVLAEAIMWGLPILATDWRGNRDVAGEGAAYVAPGPDLSEHLAAALSMLLASPNRLSQMSHDSRRRFESEFRLESATRPYRNFVAAELEVSGV